MDKIVEMLKEADDEERFRSSIKCDLTFGTDEEVQSLKADLQSKREQAMEGFAKIFELVDTDANGFLDREEA